MKNFVGILSSAFLVTIPALSVFAQTLPDAGSELQKQERLEQFRRLPDQIPEKKERVTPAPKPAADTVTVFVKDFVFTGSITVFSPDELRQIVAPYVNRNNSLDDIQAAVDAVTNAYQTQGYILGRAVLPPQEITDGIITIEVYEGILDSDESGIRINGTDIRIREERVRGILSSAVKQGQALEEKALERGVLLISDLPGIHASANLEKGNSPGTTRIVLDVTESPVLRPAVSIDNTGSRLTGEYRSTFDLDINDNFGYGEQISVTGQKSLGAGDYQYLKVEGSVPLGNNGFRLSSSLRRLEYKAGKEFASLDSEGTATLWTVDGHYPVIRQRSTSLYTNIGVEYKKLIDSSLGSTTNHRVIRHVKAGLTATHVDDFLEGGFTIASVNGYKGHADLKGNDASFAADQGANGADTHGTYEKLMFDVRRIQRASDDFYVIADISGQVASGNLTSSEKFQLGGVSGVRAYPGGEGSGDNGILASIEGRYMLMSGTPVGDVRLSAFL